jgi:2-(1,2-epoxy-1,2-dihydrophenyl)acetyl-CoA isomerase
VAEPAIILERDGDVAIIRLDRPEARNSLRLDDIRLLRDLLDRVAASDARCLLLCGTGDAFCAGRDLKETDPERDDTRAILAELINPLLLRLHDLPIPSLALVRGPALGLGLGLALACDITVVAENALVGSPFRAIGCILDAGGHYFLQHRLGRHKAAELVFTGRLLSGREAAAVGLVNRAVAALDLDAEGLKLAQEIAAGPTAAFRASKRILGGDRGLAEVLDLEARYQAEALASRDGREGIRAFQEKRKARFIGS